MSALRLQDGLDPARHAADEVLQQLAVLRELPALPADRTDMPEIFDASDGHLQNGFKNVRDVELAGD